MSVPSLSGNGHKVTVAKLCSVSVGGTVLFGEESIIIKSFALEVLLACVIEHCMELLLYKRGKEAVQKSILLVGVCKAEYWLRGSRVSKKVV